MDQCGRELPVQEHTDPPVMSTLRVLWFAGFIRLCTQLALAVVTAGPYPDPVLVRNQASQVLEVTLPCCNMFDGCVHVIPRAACTERTATEAMDLGPPSWRRFRGWSAADSAAESLD